MGDQQLRCEIGEQWTLRGGIGTAQYEQQLDGHLEFVERVGGTVGGGAQLFGDAAQRVLEEGEQQFVFAVELQVEAAQRLPGAIDDLLYREVRRALLGDDRLRGIEEALNAFLGA